MAMNERAARALREIIKRQGNGTCADCGAPDLSSTEIQAAPEYKIVHVQRENTTKSDKATSSLKLQS
ncbi:arf-GAP with dual PH domain-containing protein 1 [Tachysurus ichikawai]